MKIVLVFFLHLKNLPFEETIDLDDMTLRDIIGEEPKTFAEISDKLEYLTKNRDIVPLDEDPYEKYDEDLEKKIVNLLILQVFFTRNKITKRKITKKQNGSLKILLQKKIKRICEQEAGSHPLDDFEDKQREEAHKDRNIEYSTNHSDIKKYYARPSLYPKRQENLKTLNPSKIERANRGILAKIKNFFSEVKEEAESLSEKLGWDEEKSLQRMLSNISDSSKSSIFMCKKRITLIRQLSLIFIGNMVT
jgi:hypothetical protein